MSDDWRRFSGAFSGDEQREFVPFLHRLIGSAFATIRPYFLRPLAVESKTDRSPVTQADRQTELALRRLIEERYPLHAVRGEEYGERGGGPYRWVLDPIDGTRAFMAGLPVWGTLIGLMRRGTPVYGLMHQPFTRERFFGDGEMATWRSQAGGQAAIERKLRVRACSALKDAVLMTTSLLSPWRTPVGVLFGSSSLQRALSRTSAWSSLAEVAPELCCRS